MIISISDIHHLIKMGVLKIIKGTVRPNRLFTIRCSWLRPHHLLIMQTIKQKPQFLASPRRIASLTSKMISRVKVMMTKSTEITGWFKWGGRMMMKNRMRSRWIRMRRGLIITRTSLWIKHRWRWALNHYGKAISCGSSWKGSIKYRHSQQVKIFRDISDFLSWEAYIK